MIQVFLLSIILFFSILILYEMIMRLLIPLIVLMLVGGILYLMIYPNSILKDEIMNRGYEQTYSYL